MGGDRFRSWVVLVAWLILPAGWAAAQAVEPDFRPQLVAVEFTAREVRPGDPFAMTLKFRNAGTKPARSDYWVFVHFEAPRKSCQDIVIHADHLPSEPTSLWLPGQVVLDGPRILTAPTDKPEQTYFVHVGIYEQGGRGGRLLDSYEGGTLRVTRQAPPAASLAPPALPREELQQRRRALAARIAPSQSASLETAAWRFDLERTSGAWRLTDKGTTVQWTSDPTRPRFGEILLRNGSRSAVWRIDRFEQVEQTSRGLRLVSRPLVDGQPAGVCVTFSLTPVTAPDGLKLAYETQAEGAWQVARVRCLDNALTVTEAERGCLYVPERLGVEFPAATGLPGHQQWVTYDGLSMGMCGAVKDGSALLVNWEQVDTCLTVNTAWPDLPLVPGRRSRSLTLEISAPQGQCTLHPLGRGSYVEIARAYRPLAKAKGWLHTWADKRPRDPTVDRIFGATDFKPFVFTRLVPSSRFNPDKQERTHVSFTFEEAAQCAEHWRRDLEIERAFVVLAGWINGGYDVRHPDVLPAAAECGGDQALAAAARRIKGCGYLFGLHDNYQDMYEDAPSWGQPWLNKDARGVARQGGNWAGGQAWQVCAVKQVELAARPQTNLPKIAELFGPSIYFIDTVFAWGLVTCEDPAHPMTRLDDLRWKTKLCQLAKQHCGLFGSEEGREWAVPCADYLEGIFSHQTASPPGAVIPLFPLVYSDCVQLMTHQGDRIGPGDEKKVADHILFAEMPLPSFGSHRYWAQPAEPVLPVAPLTPRLKDLGQRKFQITYRWKVDQPIVVDYSMFVHFTHPASTRPDGIAYQHDHRPQVPTSRWQPGVVEDGPYTIEVPGQFDGPAEIGAGWLRNGQRVALASGVHEGLRYALGTIVVTPQGIEFRPSPSAPSGRLWSRGDGGWGEQLGAEDRVIKNTWEVLSPLNVLTAETPLTSHEFLTADRLVQRTRFGELTITVAYDKPAQVGAHFVPAYGFVIESPQFIAFCATRYNGVEYATPTLFTARSLDSRPLAESSRVRIYHGFGDRRLRLCGKELAVAREEIVGLR